MDQSGEGRGTIPEFMKSGILLPAGVVETCATFPSRESRGENGLTVGAGMK